MHVDDVRSNAAGVTPASDVLLGGCGASRSTYPGVEHRATPRGGRSPPRPGRGDLAGSTASRRTPGAHRG